MSYFRDTSMKHTHGGVTHHHGEPDHMAYVGRPFHEARAVVRERAAEEKRGWGDGSKDAVGTARVG